MDIILDVTRVVRRLVKKRVLTGIDRVTMAYVQHYADQARALVRWSGRSWVLSQRQSHKLFLWLMAPSSWSKLSLIILRGIVENQPIPRRHNTFLLNTGHIGLNQTDYQRLALQQGVKPIFVVHDLIPILFPEYCSPGEDLRHQKKIDYIVSVAQGIIANSQATQNALAHYCQQNQKALPTTTVALLGSGLSPKKAGLCPLAKPYFIILSTIEPRKNHLLLLQLWRKLAQNLGPQTPHLFIIGQRGWECENAVDLLDRCPGLKEVVTEVSYCPDADLVTYLHYCQALLFPSFIEGYGLPLLEALSFGVPVIASDLPVFREIAGDIPDYRDPLDAKQWETLILEYAQEKSMARAEQMQRMTQLKVPTWDEHFVKINSFLESV